MARRFRVIACLFVGAARVAVALSAQGRRQLTIVAIYDPQQRVDFSRSPPDDFRLSSVTRLTTAPGDEEEATFSPNGRLVAFIRSHNLHVADIASQHEQAITSDGGPQVLNGQLDWLYQEEIYGRGRFRGYWWS